MMLVGLMARLMLATLLLAASVACQYDPFAHQFTKVRPTTEDLVGLYELDERSIDMIRQYAIPPPASRLALESDGTFAISEVPTLLARGA